MINLIIKDILIQKKNILFVLGYCFFLVFAFQSLDQAGPIAANIAVVYILLISSFAYEDRNKSEIMLNSLPISRTSIVLAKYLSLFVYMGLAILAYMASSLIVYALRIPVKVVLLSLEGITTAFVTVAIMNSIYLPIIFKFGYIKAKLFNLVIFLLFFFVPTILVNIYNNPKYNQYISSFFAGLKSWNNWQICSLLIVLSLLALSISYLISVSIYKKREF